MLVDLREVASFPEDAHCRFCSSPFDETHVSDGESTVYRAPEPQTLVVYGHVSTAGEL